MPDALPKKKNNSMNILILIAGFWGGFFLLTLALAAANSRKNNNTDPVQVDFKINPHLFSRPEDLEPLRQIITTKLNSSTNRRARRLAGEERETIFVIDDDPDILNLIKHVLDLEGFHIRAFTNPEEALEEFQSATVRPQMVVTDFCMEPMNGLELITKCRALQPDLKTVVISGMIDEESLNKTPTRLDRFIPKPFKVANLVKTLNETLASN
jgi:CheY-like chemotaxis protein